MNKLSQRANHFVQFIKFARLSLKQEELNNEIH